MRIKQRTKHVRSFALFVPSLRPIWAPSLAHRCGLYDDKYITPYILDKQDARPPPIAQEKIVPHPLYVPF